MYMFGRAGRRAAFRHLGLICSFRLFQKLFQLTICASSQVFFRTPFLPEDELHDRSIPQDRYRNV